MHALIEAIWAEIAGRWRAYLLAEVRPRSSSGRAPAAMSAVVLSFFRAASQRAPKAPEAARCGARRCGGTYTAGCVPTAVDDGAVPSHCPSPGGLSGLLAPGRIGGVGPALVSIGVSSRSSMPDDSSIEALRTSCAKAWRCAKYERANGVLRACAGGGQEEEVAWRAGRGSRLSMRVNEGSEGMGGSGSGGGGGGTFDGGVEEVERVA